MEVAGPVEEADPDHRQGEVGGLLDDVTGQDAQPAGVHGQRRVHAELSAEERDGTLRVAQPRLTGPVQVSVHHRGELCHAPDEVAVGRHLRESDRGHIEQLAHGVGPHPLPTIRIERRKGGVAVRRPGPPVVVRELGEWNEGLGQPCSQGGDGRGYVVITRGHGRSRSSRSNRRRAGQSAQSCPRASHARRRKRSVRTCAATSRVGPVRHHFGITSFGVAATSVSRSCSGGPLEVRERRWV